MSQSLVQMYVHIVFSTKDRPPFIESEIKQYLVSRDSVAI